MTQQQEQLVVGWYADLVDGTRERYWDGEAWDARTRPSAAVATFVAAVATPRKGWFARHKALTAVGALMVLAGIGAGAVFVAGGALGAQDVVTSQAEHAEPEPAPAR
jgi:hypothetical protein